nr:Isocitrate dehydrogenase [NADP] [Ipomoea batatas]
MSSPRIRSLAAKLTTGDSGNLSGCPTTLNSVARFPEPLNGVLPNKSSYRKIPNVHQSTALPWPSPLIISGAKYSCVPTNDMDRALLGSAISSGRGETWLPISVFGFLLFLDLLEKRRGEKQVVVTAQDVICFMRFTDTASETATRALIADISARASSAHTALPTLSIFSTTTYFGGSTSLCSPIFYHPELSQQQEPKFCQIPLFAQKEPACVYSSTRPAKAKIWTYLHLLIDELRWTFAAFQDNV